ncbi:2-oxo-4-hydroxy-4-carboxy-5-ureidoimidazoline decarboxylase [Streptomyces rimosus]
MSSNPTPGLARFNAASDRAARAALHEACASEAWGNHLLAHRPYATTEALYAASDAAMAELTPADLAEAMAGHGMSDADADLKAEMLELNLAYQEKFGHVFLICATGLTGEQLRDAARNRVDNTPEQEREIVRTELGKINRIRLGRLVEDAADPADAVEGATP